MKTERDAFERAQLEHVAGMKPGAVNAHAIHEGSVRAALVDDDPGATLVHDGGVTARDQRVGHNQILAGKTAERRGVAAENQGVVTV